MRHKIEDLESKIKSARLLYEAGEDTGLTDAEYDALEAELRVLDPNNKILKAVGAPRAGKVTLPYPMNGLDQVFAGEMSKWVANRGLGDYCVSDKLDGVSVLLQYFDGTFINAFSRGNGIEGANVSRHVLKMSFPRTIKGYRGDLFVRGEVIMTNSNFDKINAQYEGKYKNARNFVAGQMNRETAIPEFYPNVDLVAYTMVHPDVKTKTSEISELDQSGFKTPDAMLVHRVYMTEENMVDLLKDRREKSLWQLDGLVIGLNEEPKTTVKFKVGTEENVATTEVLYVEWNTSKDGYLKPRISIRPVQLMGVTVSWVTGHNAKYIVDNVIGPGAVIKITRSGDVIPWIMGIELPAQEPDLPELDFVWTDTGVDIRVFDSFDAEVMKMVHCFGTLGVHGAGEGVIRKMMTEVKDSTSPLLASKNLWTEIVGVNGTKVYDNLQEKLKTVSIEKFADAVGVFGRGVGERKLESITNHGIDFTGATVKQLVTVPGIESKTAEKIVAGQNAFRNYLHLIPYPHSPLARRKAQTPAGEGLVGQAFCFTGFRSPESEAKIKAMGGTMSDSRFTTLVVKDPATMSSKKLKAVKLGANVITLDELKKLLG